ncbi:MAG: glycosyltransferase family 4 protein [Nonlabens sp.]
MKIILFDGTFETTAFIRRLMQGLINANHQIFILGFNERLSNPVSGVNYISLGSNQNKIRFIKTSLSWAVQSKSLINSLKYIFLNNKSKVQQSNLEAAFNSIQPDIVHLQWVSNIPLFEDFLKKSTHRFILSQRGFQTNIRPFVNSDNYNYLKKWLPYFNGFHSVSNAISNKGDHMYNDHNKIDHVVYTGLDMDQIEYSKKEPDSDVFQIISVGRQHWVKGYDHAIKAMSLLLNKNIKFKYSIVGAQGDEELLFLVDDLNLRDCVELLPKLPQNEVFKLINRSSVLLMPSLEEGIANVAVEAMALGTPVISTNCGGMEELITHNETGWIVPVYEEEALAHQILEFTRLSNHDVLNVVNFARAKVEKQHSEEQMVEGMLELYQKVQSVDI